MQALLLYFNVRWTTWKWSGISETFQSRERNQKKTYMGEWVKELWKGLIQPKPCFLEPNQAFCGLHLTQQGADKTRNEKPVCTEPDSVCNEYLLHMLLSSLFGKLKWCSWSNIYYDDPEHQHQFKTAVITTWLASYNDGPRWTLLMMCWEQYRHVITYCSQKANKQIMLI